MGLLVRSLLLLGTLALPGTWAASHSLRYFDTAVTRPGLGDPRFLMVGYVDDQQFSSFDSDSESQREEPRAEWMEGIEREEQEYWKGNMRTLRESTQLYRVNLEILRGYFNQSAEGVHTLQRMYGCEVTPELRFRRGFYQSAYDGQDYIALDTETYTWTAAVPPAVNSKRKLEAERSISEGHRVYLEETCVMWLKKYLEMGNDSLQRADPPSVRVTRHAAPHGEVTLRCRTQDFYPSDISLTWLREGQEQFQDTEFIAGVGVWRKKNSGGKVWVYVPAANLSTGERQSFC